MKLCCIQVAICLIYKMSRNHYKIDKYTPALAHDHRSITNKKANKRESNSLIIELTGIKTMKL